MARYIEMAGLATAIGQRDWEAFARGYNGPGYKKFCYDRKIAAAYQRHAGVTSLPDMVKAGASELRQGSSGEAVRDLQQCLSALGYPLKADGLFGKDTERAVLVFQRDHELPADGIAGPRTFAAITEAMPFRPRTNGRWMSLYIWLATAFGRM